MGLVVGSVLGRFFGDRFKKELVVGGLGVVVSGFCWIRYIYFYLKVFCNVYEKIIIIIKFRDLGFYWFRADWVVVYGFEFGCGSYG